MNNKVREPKQKRSIEKKSKIIEAGFDLICEKGYYNTNTAEIAKYAGVSTGIVYQYFKDKHDILIEGIKIYGKNIFYPIHKITEEDFSNNNLNEILKDIVNKFIENHKVSKIAHEEIMAMSHIDEEVSSIFNEAEIEITKKITDLLIKNGFNSENLSEKVHISINLIDSLCHEILYHKHPDMDYNSMIDIVIKIIENTLFNK